MTNTCKAADPGHPKPSILLVEDDLISQAVVARILRRAGYPVAVAADGFEAQRALTSEAPGLVLTDCHLPGMDGFALARAIRNADIPGVAKDLPIIGLTSPSAHNDRGRCLAAGMNDVIYKPPEAGLLLDRVASALGPGSAATETDPADRPAVVSPLSEPDFRDAVIDKFLELIPAEIAALERALEHADMTRLGELGHRLKGSAALVEAARLSSLALALEKAGRAGEPEETGRHAQALIAELQKMAALRDE